jgi:hypothetical protein
MVFENRELRRLFRPKRKKWQETGDEYKMMSFKTCMVHQTLLGQ